MTNIFENLVESTFDQENLINQLKGALSKGATFVSYIYRAKSGSVRIYNRNLGVDYSHSLEEDRKKLLAYSPKNEAEEAAKEAMLKSMLEHKENGISSSYTKDPNMYTYLGKGLKINKKTGDLVVGGFVQSSTELKPRTVPVKPPVSPVAVAKAKIKKELKFKTNSYQEHLFAPGRIAGLRIKGQLITFLTEEGEPDVTEEQLMREAEELKS